MLQETIEKHQNEIAALWKKDNGIRGWEESSAGSISVMQIFSILQKKLKFIYALALWIQRERDCLLAEVENLAANTDGQTQKLEDIHAQKLKTLEAQVPHPQIFIWNLNLFSISEDILNYKKKTFRNSAH